LFSEIGAIPQIRGETFTAVSACQLVGKGVGITLADPFVPSLFLKDPAICIRPLSPRIEHEYLVLSPAGQNPGPVAEQFIACVRETARQIVDSVERSAARKR